MEKVFSDTKRKNAVDKKLELFKSIKEKLQENKFDEKIDELKKLILGQPSDDVKTQKFSEISKLLTESYIATLQQAKQELISTEKAEQELVSTEKEELKLSKNIEEKLKLELYLDLIEEVGKYIYAPEKEKTQKREIEEIDINQPQESNISQTPKEDGQTFVFKFIKKLSELSNRLNHVSEDLQKKNLIKEIKSYTFLNSEIEAYFWKQILNKKVNLIIKLCQPSEGDFRCPNYDDFVEKKIDESITVNKKHVETSLNGIIRYDIEITNGANPTHKVTYLEYLA